MVAGTTVAACRRCATICEKPAQEARCRLLSPNPHCVSAMNLATANRPKQKLCRAGMRLQAALRTDGVDRLSTRQMQWA